MPDPKIDISTDILQKVNTFLIDINSELEDLREDRLKKLALEQKRTGEGEETSTGRKKTSPSSVPRVRFILSGYRANPHRKRPKQHAIDIANASSWVCWSSHMSDNARNVVMKVNGETSNNPREAFGEDFNKFKEKWVIVMKKYGLRNVNDEELYYESNPFYLQLPTPEPDNSDEHVLACLDEYVRLTRVGDKDPNEKFETMYAEWLAPIIEKYEAPSEGH